MTTINGTCEHCGKDFSYNDCADLSGMMEETTEYTCCRKCAESRTVTHPDHC